MATLVPMAKGEPWPVWPLPGVWKGVPTKGGRRFGAYRGIRSGDTDLLAAVVALGLARRDGPADKGVVQVLRIEEG